MPDTGRAARVLVVGYGNALRSDDGVGWHVARMLAGDPRLAEAGVVAEHQLTPELAYDISTAGLVVFVDASTATPAGSVSVRRMEASGADTRTAGHAGGARAEAGATFHHVTPELLVALARELYGTAPDAVLVSVGVAEMGLGEALTPLVAAALPVVADTVARLVEEHGVVVAAEAARPA
jgi:hydrogenase maturation protease